jgi:lactoylglutathione lyase
MFSHVTIGVSDFDRAHAFYSGLMGILGIEPRFCQPAVPWAGWQSTPGPRPLFIIGKPFDGQAHNPGNGQMVAFLAPSRSVARAAYEFAMSHGGTDEGAPGLRPHYHPNYYGAYFRDPEGNKLCVACHESEN